MKNIFIEIKNSLNILHSSLDTAVERMSALDSISEGMNQNAAQREKEMENMKAWFEGIEDETRRYVWYMFRVLEGENREN